MKRLDRNITHQSKLAFLAEKRRGPIGVWCGDLPLTALVRQFLAMHGEYLWVGERTLVEDAPTTKYVLTHAGWHVELELTVKGWTAYAIDEQNDGDWIAIPGTPFTTEERAAKAAEGFLNETVGAIRDLARGYDDRPGVGEPEVSEGGTRGYLLRGS